MVAWAGFEPAIVTVSREKAQCTVPEIGIEPATQSRTFAPNSAGLCDTERHAKKNNEIARKGPETCGRQACEIRQCQVADVGIE